jgi:hypothetical protein
MELQSGRYGFKLTNKNSNFYEYYHRIAAKKQGASTYNSWQTSLNVFRDLAGEHIAFSEITEEFCEKFLEYLQNKISVKDVRIKLFAVA